jgi:hypothetical protein
MAAQRISVAQALAAADVEIFQDDGGGIPANAVYDRSNSAAIVDRSNGATIQDRTV